MAARVGDQNSLHLKPAAEIAAIGKTLNRQIYDLTKEFERTTSCCLTCYEKLMEKLKAQREFQEQYISDINFAAAVRPEFSIGFTPDEILAMTIPISVGLSLADRLESQITVKMQTISRRICFKESIRTVFSEYSRRLEPTLQRMKKIGRVAWGRYKAFEGVFRFIATDKLPKTIVTKRSYTWRDNILPSGIVLSSFCRNRIFAYGLISTLVFGIGSALVLEKYGFITTPDERYKTYCSELHSFHKDFSGPIIEECFYRGIIQNGCSLLTGSSFLGLMLSSILFGTTHFDSHKKGNYGHVVSAGFSGVLLGLLNQHFGFSYSVHFHCFWNSFCSLLEWAFAEKSSVPAAI